MKTGIFDIYGTEITVGDTISYIDTEHEIYNENGTVRYNEISDTFEVINNDIQSGNNLSSVTNIQIWQ